MTSSEGRSPFDVVVVAAGASRRMDGLDKIDALVHGRPLVAWTLAAFAGVPEAGRIVLVTSQDRVERYRTAQWLPDRVAAVLPGGTRRQDSVAVGVRWLAADSSVGPGDRAGRVVLIHDGARPLIATGLIRQIAAAAAEHGAAIPVLPVTETIKELDGSTVLRTVERSRLAAAQTPQAVRLGLLEQAYGQFPPESAPIWTDEAALLEACTITVHAIPGDPSNLKVTVPSDLQRVEVALAGPRPPDPIRIGSGSDSHPFGPGRPLALGGIEFTDTPRLYGHSDGDVVLHAVADALLGAAALGDLGREFPADSSTPAGVSSGRLLDGVVRRLAEAGYRAQSIDITILGARPRFGARLDEMRSAIADRIGVAVDVVSVKASSGNLSGDEGAGRVISAHAVAAVVPIDIAR